MSGECRTRIASGGSQKVPPSTAPVADAVPSQADRKPVVCFSCHQVGPKSPQCPKRQQGNIKRIQIPADGVTALAYNEVMGQIEGIQLPVTVDSCAHLTVVPEEMAKESQYTGESAKFDYIMQVR